MFYYFVRNSLGIIFRIIFRLKIKGRENIPLNGPVVLASNHASMLDPVLVGIASPRPINFMAKEELFDIPVLKNLFLALKSYPVKRGKFDRAAINKTLNYLKNNEIVALFPEGTRKKKSEEEKPYRGVALIAQKGNTPIVPIAILGTEKIFTKKRYVPCFTSITIKIGKPIFVNRSEKEYKEEQIVTSERVMRIINDLINEEKNEN